jgi:hypothetical protein
MCQKVITMSLNDGDQLKFEADFRYLVDKYIECLSRYHQLSSKSTLTTQEDREFQILKQLLLNICEILSTTLKSLSDDLFGKALDLYYYYKDMASKGNNDAVELVNELKPLFAASLKARVNMN